MYCTLLKTIIYYNINYIALSEVNCYNNIGPINQDNIPCIKQIIYLYYQLGKYQFSRREYYHLNNYYAALSHIIHFKHYNLRNTNI